MVTCSECVHASIAQEGLQHASASISAASPCLPTFLLRVYHLLFWYEIALLLPNKGHEDSFWNKVFFLASPHISSFLFDDWDSSPVSGNSSCCTRNRMRYNFSSWSHMNSLFRTVLFWRKLDPFHFDPTTFARKVCWGAEDSDLAIGCFGSTIVDYMLENSFEHERLNSQIIPRKRALIY